MTHLISPSTFRLSKSTLWKSNIIIKTSNEISHKNILSTTTSFNGISSILKHKLRRKRLLMVKTNIFNYNQILNCRVLFMPRIKTRPIFDGKGIFSRHVLYKIYNWKPALQYCSKSYIDQRRLKIFKFPKKKINKLINDYRGVCCVGVI